MSDKETVEKMGTYEPFIHEIEKIEAGQLNKLTYNILNHFYKGLSEGDIAYLKTKYPNTYAYTVNGFVGDLPPHEDFWERAEVGDIVMKTGTHYQSTVPNGNCYVVLEVLSGDATVIILDVDGELKNLCHPEEYKVVGKLRDKIDAKNKADKLRHEEYQRLIEESHKTGRLNFIEKMEVEQMIADGKTKEEILEAVPHCHFDGDGNPLLDIK